MEVDVADQLERIIKVLDTHPIAAFFAVLIVLLIMGFRKEGLFTAFVKYLEQRSIAEVAKEERRIEIMRMIENRREPPLPGFGNEDEESKQ